jgi:preprotein translocase subunit SecF
MLRILHDTKIDFIKSWRLALGITAAFIAAGLIALVLHGGLNRSIEFTGGTLIQVEFAKKPDVGVIRSTVDEAGFVGSEIQQFGSDTSFTIRAASHRAAAGAPVENTAAVIQRALEGKFGKSAVHVARTESVSARVGDEFSRNAMLAILISLGITLVYLAFRFEWRFGVAAVIATAHDLLSTLAFLAIMRLEVSLTVVAALLTVIGYSLNDTIIIFDRVREDLKKNRSDSLRTVLNKAINETLPRSVLTHFTVAAATLSLLVFGPEVIRPFSWIMLFGVVTGTFSSIYIAGPVLLWIEHRWPRESTTAKGGGTRVAATEVSRPSRAASTVSR